MSPIEQIPADEARQIQHIVEMTIRQLQLRYPDKRVLRGVHAKDHGCVLAKFAVSPTLSPELRVGLFAQPGRVYDAKVRFSNASVLVTPDSKPAVGDAPVEHGSRGMAVKLFGVEGPLLTPLPGPPTHDFLMINQPVFAFANVEDYEVLSRVLVEHHDDPRPFFAERLPKPAEAQPTPANLRAAKTAEIVSRIRAATTAAFQPPPASPVDNDYYGASPFLFGSDRVMRFRAYAVNRSHAAPNVADPNYLRTSLIARLRDAAAGPVVFQFEVQVRPAATLNPPVDIENASAEWVGPDKQPNPPFVPVATLTIPLQEFDTPELREQCERLIFNPWHGLQAHRPLGGINRLRRGVYEASAMFRNLAR